MKDFVGVAPRKTRAESKQSFSLFKWVIMPVILVAVVSLGWLMLRTLQWSDFVQTENQTTVLFLSEKIEQSGAYVVQFLFDELEIDVYPIPSNLPIEVAGGYGRYRFQAVYPLLALEGKELPYIRSAMSLSTGVLLDELWPADVTTLDLTSKVRFQAFLLRHLFSNRRVSFAQKISWLALISDQRTDYLVHEPLTSLPSPVFEQFNYGSERSACTVALINTTPLAGLAGRIASLLESHHFRVVRTTSDEDNARKTTVLFTDEFPDDCRVVMEKLERLVPGGVEKRVDTEETIRHRADLVIRLGNDLVD